MSAVIASKDLVAKLIQNGSDAINGQSVKDSNGNTLKVSVRDNNLVYEVNSIADSEKLGWFDSIYVKVKAFFSGNSGKVKTVNTEEKLTARIKTNKIKNRFTAELVALESDYTCKRKNNEISYKVHLNKYSKLHNDNSVARLAKKRLKSLNQVKSAEYKFQTELHSPFNGHKHEKLAAEDTVLVKVKPNPKNVKLHVLCPCHGEPSLKPEEQVTFKLVMSKQDYIRIILKKSDTIGESGTQFGGDKYSAFITRSDLINGEVEQLTDTNVDDNTYGCVNGRIRCLNKRNFLGKIPVMEFRGVDQSPWAASRAKLLNRRF